MRKISYIAKVCPSNENYWKNDGNIIYNALREGISVEFTKYNIVNIVSKNGSGEDVIKSIYFPSDRAYKRCERLYREWYYKLTPYQKGI